MSSLRPDFRTGAGLFHRRDLHQLRRHSADRNPGIFSPEHLHQPDLRPATMDLDFLRDYFSIAIFPPFQKPMVGAGSYLQSAGEVLQRTAEEESAELTA